MKRRRTAVIYVRQSKEREESTSIEDQERLCRRYCADQGYDVCEVIADRDTSGSEIPWRRRRNFPRVFDLDVDVLVVYRWSRLSRDDFDQREILKKWGALGRDAQASEEPVDASTASGKLHRGILLEFAAHEAREKSERWREALQKRADNGLPKNGLPRFGYVKTPTGYSPDPATAPVLADLYRRYTEGAGFQALVKHLNDEGVPTTRGNAWGIQTLIRALDSGFGAGLLIQDKRSHDTLTYLPGAHPAVITPEEWDAYLRARARRRTEPPRRRTAAWHLAGIATCGRDGCGSRLIRQGTLAMCSRYKATRACDGTWVKLATLESTVAFALAFYLDDLVSHLPSRAAEASRARSAVQDAREALTRAEAALGGLTADLARRIITDAAYRAALPVLQADVEAAARTLAEAQEELTRLGPLDEDAVDRLRNAPDMTPGEWGRAIGQVIREVRVSKESILVVPVTGSPETWPR